jgi:sulfur carrier protein ThiS
MTDYIMVKVASLGKSVLEVTIPVGSTVDAALKAAGVNPSATQDLRRNNEVLRLSDVVKNGDILTLVPAIRGGY